MDMACAEIAARGRIRFRTWQCLAAEKFVATLGYVKMHIICRAVSVTVLYRDNLNETLPNVFFSEVASDLMHQLRALANCFIHKRER